MKIKDKLAARAASAGLVLDGGLGSPKLPLPPEAARERYKRELDFPHGYGDRRGHLETRVAVAKWYSDRFHTRFDPDTQVRITDGSREVYFYMLKHLFGMKKYAEREKIVVLPRPFYGGHNTAVLNAGGKPVLVSGDRNHSFFDQLEERLAKGLQPLVVVASYIQNPTGVGCSREDFVRLVRLADQYDFFIASDRAYGELAYNGQPCPSIYEVESTRVLFETHTASKMFQAPHWVVGAVVGQPELMEGLTDQKSDLREGVCTPAQLAFATALSECRGYLPELCVAYHDRAKFAVENLRQAGWDTAAVPDGGMFLWLPVPTVLAEQGVDSTTLCRRLADRGIIMWPDILFHGRGTHIRFCLREENRVVANACDRIAEVIRRPEPASGGNLIPSFA